MNFLIVLLMSISVWAINEDKIKNFEVGNAAICLHYESGDLACRGQVSFGLIPGEKDHTTFKKVLQVGKLASIRSGQKNMCAETKYGAFICWGDLPRPEQGKVYVLSQPTQFKMPSGFEIAKYEPGNPICVMFKSGEVGCWGNFKDLYVATLEFLKNDYGKFTNFAADTSDGSCGRTQNGDLVCWSWKTGLQAQKIDIGEPIKDVAVGGQICVLTMKDALKCFQDQNFKEPIIHFEKGVKSITSGTGRICAHVDDDLYCWGVNFGNLEERKSRKPILIVENKEIISFTASCAELKSELKERNYVCWNGFEKHPVPIDSSMITTQF